MVVQPHRKLVTNQGRGYHIRCKYQTQEKTVTNAFNVRYVLSRDSSFHVVTDAALLTGSHVIPSVANHSYITKAKTQRNQKQIKQPSEDSKFYSHCLNARPTYNVIATIPWTLILPRYQLHIIFHHMTP